MPTGQAKEARAFGGPSRYVQGPGEFANLPTFVSYYGKTAMAMVDPFFMEEFSVKLPQMFEAAGMKVYVTEFPGLCCDANIEKMIAYAESLPELPDAFIGIGGGQTCDMDKVLGAHFRKATIVCPTSLATDAPTSQHTIVNNPGEINHYIFHYKNPDYVVVDTDITIKSPAFMYISGIGDALATYVEAEATLAHNNVTNVAGFRYKPTLLAMSAARTCYEVLLEQGRAAVLAAKNHIRTQAYEDCAEATTLLSGLGFECTGVSIAHALQAAFFAAPIEKPLLHGAGVGYGTLILVLLNNEVARFEELYQFCKDVGLPVCTRDLGIPAEKRTEWVEAIVDEAYPARWSIHNVPYYVSRDMLLNAIYYLDAYHESHS